MHGGFDPCQDMLNLKGLLDEVMGAFLYAGDGLAEIPLAGEIMMTSVWGKSFLIVLRISVPSMSGSVRSCNTREKLFYFSS